jgi:hypothetical protein
LERIDDSAFRESGLKSIDIPSSVVVLGKSSFHWCKSLESVTFESGSQLEWIDDCAFRESGLKSICIPSSIVFLGAGNFYECKSLESVTIESGSRLEWINESMFYGTRVNRRFVADSLAASRSGERVTLSKTCRYF